MDDNDCLWFWIEIPCGCWVEGEEVQCIHMPCDEGLKLVEGWKEVVEEALIPARKAFADKHKNKEREET